MSDGGIHPEAPGPVPREVIVVFPYEPGKKP